LQQQRALEKLAAVQSAAKQKVPLQQGAGLTEKVEDFLIHRCRFTSIQKIYPHRK
jgi:hypothetical protein